MFTIETYPTINIAVEKLRRQRLLVSRQLPHLFLGARDKTCSHYKKMSQRTDIDNVERNLVALQKQLNLLLLLLDLGT